MFIVKNWKMAAKQNSSDQEEQTPSDDIPLTSLEESLFSSEKLDRASPELWPEQNTHDLNYFFDMGDENVNVTHSEDESQNSVDFAVPGVSEFTPLPNANAMPPSWNRGLTKEDCAYMQQLGSLSISGLIMEVKKLHDMAYQLGLEEAKEMTRGKYLNIFNKRNR